jgi:hypothetical protein
MRREGEELRGEKCHTLIGLFIALLLLIRLGLKGLPRKL